MILGEIEYLDIFLFPLLQKKIYISCMNKAKFSIREL